MAKIVEKKITDLHFDDKNANKHTPKGQKLLEKSLQKKGFGRSILLDKDDNIIAGNSTVEVAGQVGFENVKIIETDGTEIIAVKRTDLSINSKKGRSLAIADNQTAKAGIEFDLEVIENLSDDYNCDFVDEWELTESQGMLRKTFERDNGVYDDKGLPFPVTIIITEEDYNQWVEIKKQLKINNDRDAFFKLTGIE